MEIIQPVEVARDVNIPEDAPQTSAGANSGSNDPSPRQVGFGYRVQ